MIQKWRDYVKNRPLVARILGNSGWLFADRVLGMAVGLFVGLPVARYLRPERFGRLQFCLALSGLFTGLAALGLEGIVVRDFVRFPELREKTLATVFTLRVASGAVFGTAAWAVVWLMKPLDGQEHLIMAWLCLVLVFQSTEVVDWYFQSQYRSEEVVRARWLPVVISALFRIGLILCSASLLSFGFAEAFQAGAMALGLAWIFRRSGLQNNLVRPALTRGKELLKESWAFTLSAIAMSVYMEIDVFMLGIMASSKETGLYASAAKVSEMWYFVPLALASASFPAIVAARDEFDVYRRRFQELHDLMFMLSVSVAVGITFTAPWLVNLLYGHLYEGAVPMLRVHVWAGIFVAWGVLFARWVIAEGKGKFFAFASALGAVINVALNFWWIPRWGGLGASWATVVAYAVSGSAVTLASRKSRMLFLMQLYSFAAPWRLLKKLMP